MEVTEVSFITGAAPWRVLPKLPIEYPVHPYQADVRAYAQIAYDMEAIHICMHAFEQEIRKQEQGPYGMPCRDSCLEFFICPVYGDDRYFNFEFNPNGCLFLGFGSCIDNLVRLTIDEATQKMWFCPEIEILENEWRVVFRIPYRFIRQFFPDFNPIEKTLFQGNFYKCGECVREPHYLAWNPIKRKGKSVFHTPGEFGKLMWGPMEHGEKI